MKLKVILSIFLTLFFLSCSTDVDEATVTYNEDSSVNIGNPDRGFYQANYHLIKENDDNMFEEVKKAGNTLAYGLIFLEDYLETETLPEELLENIDNNLKDAEELNIKIIFRIKYRDSDGQDPTKEIALSHLEQLKTVLQKHKEIISIVHAGVIGAWGEWHSFTGDYASFTEDYIQNRKDIITALSEIFPDKYIQIRTPMHKELLYGSAEYYREEGTDGQITEKLAFSDDMRAKVAHHNDCFLASKDDWGTYADDNIDFWRDYVINDTKYSPVGGETCNDDVRYTECSNALSELETFQWSYINESYHEDVIQRWKDEGCYQTIRKNIGYRLVATGLYLEQTSSTLDIKLKVSNKGYAAPYIKSDVNYILKDANSTNTYNYSVDDVDLRTFYPGRGNTISKKISLSSLTKGTYCLYVQLRKNYSDIKLSNIDLWDEDINANRLTCDIVIE